MWSDAHAPPALLCARPTIVGRGIPIRSKSKRKLAKKRLLTPKEALDSTLDKDDNNNDDDDGEALPVPMVNVTCMLDDNNDLSSFVCQIAIPASAFDNDFIPVVCCSSQARSSSNSVRSS
jgi:hypothetical protein